MSRECHNQLNMPFPAQLAFIVVVNLCATISTGDTWVIREQVGLVALQHESTKTPRESSGRRTVSGNERSGVEAAKLGDA